MRTLSVLALAAAIVRGGDAWAGSYVYTPIVVGNEGAYSVQLTGINESDVVAGTQTTSTPTQNPNVYTFVKRGFVWRNGAATLFDAPAGATFVGSGRINRYGIVLAQDTLADGTAGSFTYNSVSGAVRQIAVPGAASVSAVSISNGGAIAGSVTVAGGGGASHSFVIRDGVARIFDPPGAISSGAGFVSPDGTISGSFYVADPKVTSGYVYKDGVYTILNSPFGQPFQGIAETSAGYVSPHGVVLADFNVGIAQTGFVYHDGVYSDPMPTEHPFRVLKDGSIFSVSYGFNDHVCIDGRPKGGCLIPPGIFTLDPADVNENGAFVGRLGAVSENPYTVYYENFIATCPAGEFPCR